MKNEYIDIKFQEGTVTDVGVNGCQIEDVIDVLIERINGFQSGVTPCMENVKCLTNLKAAKTALQLRTSRRKLQGTEGTHEETDKPSQLSLGFK